MSIYLVPVDFSPVTDDSMHTALSLAAKGGARLIFLYVVYPTPSVDAMHETAAEHRAKLDAKEARAVPLLDALVGIARANGVPAERHVARGAPASQILRFAHEFDTDLIVMGSHGHSSVYNFIVGSTTGEVLKKAPCAVAIVPPVKEAAHRRRNPLSVHTMVDEELFGK